MTVVGASLSEPHIVLNSPAMSGAMVYDKCHMHPSNTALLHYGVA